VNSALAEFESVGTKMKKFVFASFSPVTEGQSKPVCLSPALIGVNSLERRFKKHIKNLLYSKAVVFHCVGFLLSYISNRADYDFHRKKSTKQ